jgi:CreA protein
MRFSIASALLAAAASLLAADQDARPLVRYRPSLLVQLQVQDLDRSIRFYTETLGFELSERRDDLQFAHIDLGLRGLQLGLAAGGPRPPDGGTVALNLGVQGDVEVARRALESRGVRFDGPTVVIPGKVRLAAFKDPDGYRIRLAGEDTEATP